MKKIIIGLALALLTLGCAKEYDDSTLTARVDQLEKDVRDIKAQLKDLNSQAAGVNAAIEAWKAGGFVQSITDVKENNVVVGYTITFVGGQTVTIYHGQKGDQGNPGNPGNPGDPGHSPVVTIGQVEGYDGLYWLVDGAPLKVNDKPVPVTVLPTFTINAEGHLIATVDGVETDLGTVMGVGESLIDEITPGTDAVTFKLADGTTFDVPMAKAFKLVIETKDFEVAAGATKEIAYDVQNADESTVVEVFANNYAYKASVDATAKKIKVTVPDPFVPGEVLVWAQNDKGLTSLVKLSFIQAAGLIIVTDETNYQTISKDGGDVVVNLTSNVDVDVKQPAEDWVHAAITKAEYKLTLTLDANPTTEPREADIEIVRKDNGNTVQTIKIIQLGGELVMPTAAVDDVLWSETWTGGVKDASVTAYTQTGTTVFGDFKVKYSSVKPEGGTDIKLYVDNQMDGSTEQENLLLSKNGGTWTISGIPSGNAKKALLTIKANSKRDPDLSSTTEGVSIGTRNVGAETSKPYTYTWEISFTDVKLFNLTFTLTNSSNIRIDDVVLKVTEAGEGGAVVTPKVLKVTKLWEKLSTSTEDWFTTIGGASGADFNIAIDDQNVYIPQFGNSKNLWAIDIATGNTIKKVNTSTVESKGFDGSIFLSCARVVKKNDGTPVLIATNLAQDTDSDNPAARLYIWDDGVDAAPRVVTMQSWAAGRRLGDTFTTYGNYEDCWLLMSTQTGNGIVTFKLPTGNICYLISRLAIDTGDFCSYYPFPGDLLHGMFTWRGGTHDDGIAYRNRLATINSTEDAIKTAGAHTMELSKLATWMGNYENNNGSGFNYIEFNGKRYAIWVINMADKKTFDLVIKEGATDTPWQTIIDTKAADITAAGGFAFRESLVGGKDTTWKEGTDCAVWNTGSEVYIAVNKCNVGLAVYKMYLE